MFRTNSVFPTSDGPCPTACNTSATSTTSHHKKYYPVKLTPVCLNHNLFHTPLPACSPIPIPVLGLLSLLHRTLICSQSYPPRKSSIPHNNTKSTPLPPTNKSRNNQKVNHLYDMLHNLKESTVVTVCMEQQSQKAKGF